MIIKIINNKRKAQMHVEMVLSFVIFLGFLLFLLYYLNPIGKEEIGFASLDRVQDKILSNISVDYREATLIVNTIPDKDCITLDENVFLTENLVAFNFDGNQVGAEEQGGSNKINIDSVISNGTYKVLSSKVFIEIDSSPPCNDFSDYDWGLVGRYSAVFTDYLAEFNSSYMADYFKLKESLGLERDFDFVVYNEIRGIIYNESLSTRNIRGNNILSRDIPLIMIDENGFKTKIIFNLRVW